MAHEIAGRSMVGARLHAARIAHAARIVGVEAASGSMKTVKLPVTTHDAEADYRIARAVQADDTSLLGVTNEVGLYEIAQGGGEQYSVLDFWYDTVCSGGVFAGKIPLLAQVASTLGGVATETERLLAQSLFSERIIITRAVDFLSKRKRSTSTLRGTSKQIQGLFTKCPHSKEECAALAARILAAETEEDEFSARVYAFGLEGAAAPATGGAKRLKDGLNFTVCLLPGSEYVVPSEERASRDLVLLARLRKLQAALGEDSEKDAYQYLGINENALSNFLGAFFPMLRSGELERIADAMQALCPAWEPQRHELLERLLFLQERSRMIPEYPALSSGWNEYRARLAGRLSSWFSGYLGKLATAISQLSGARDDVARMDELVEAHADPGSEDDIVLAESISFLDQCLAKASQTDADCVRAMRAVRLVLPGASYAFNQFIKRPAVQQSLRERPPTREAKSKVRDKRSIDFSDAFPHITGMQAVPFFYGGESRRNFREFLNAARYMDRFLPNLKDIWEKLWNGPRTEPENAEAYFFRHIQQVFRVYRNLSTERFRERVNRALLPVLHVEFAAIPDRPYFCSQAPNAGSGGKRVTVVVPFGPERALALQCLDRCLEVCAALSEAAGFEWKRLSAEERRDVVEIQKTTFALLVGISHSAVDVGQYDWCENDTVADFLSVCDSTRLSGMLLGQFLQQAVFAKLRGACTLLSKKRLLARFEVQGIDSLDLAYRALGCRERVEGECKFSVSAEPGHPGAFKCRIAYPVVVGRENRIYVRTFDAVQEDKRDSGDGRTSVVYAPLDPSKNGETVRVEVRQLGESYEVAHAFLDGLKRPGRTVFRAGLVCNVQRPDGYVRLLYEKRRRTSPGTPGIPRELSDSFVRLAPGEFLSSLGKVSEADHAKRLQLRTYPHQWGYRLSLPFPGAVPDQPPLEELRVMENGGAARFGSVKLFRAGGGPILWVQGTPTQRQYLEWALARFKGRKTDVVLKGASLIAERRCAVHWDLESLLPVVSGEERSRLFVAQPYATLPLPDRPLRNTAEEGPCFLGVDAGERGVGYAFLRCRGEHFETVAQGFVLVPELARLLASGPKFKLAQRRGTYDFRSRRKALRDIAAQVLRNALHNLRLRFEDIPVFEWQPPAKSADSLEGVYSHATRADIPSNNADYLVRRTVWGISANPSEPFALELYVRGTSQFCSKCRRWYQLSLREGNGSLPEEEDREKDGIRVVACDKGIVTIALPDVGGEVYGYNPALKAGDHLSVPLAVKTVNMFMRPPMRNRQGELTETYVRFLQGKTWRGYAFDEEFVAQYGGKAMYVCPYTDCLAVAHADIQAAETLALLGHVFLHKGLTKGEWRDPAVVWGVLSQMKKEG